VRRAGNRVHEIRNQICPPLIHILHLRPALIDALLQADETIVTAANCKGRDYDDKEHDGDHNAATDGKFVHRPVNGSGNTALSQPPRPSTSRRNCASEKFPPEPCRTMIAFNDGITNSRW